MSTDEKGTEPAAPSADPGAGGTVAVPEDPPPTREFPATPAPRRGSRQHSRISGMWVGLILSAVVLLFLLIFILQNLDPVAIHFLGADGRLPTGVALLLGAIAGILLVAIPGTARIVQLRRAAKRSAKRLQ